VAGATTSTALVEGRIVFLGSQVDDDVANLITAQFLFLESRIREGHPLHVNSPGGSVTAGLAIYDTMQYQAGTSDALLGQAASMAAWLLAVGREGSALPSRMPAS
jgi:ATP-dependent Clp protease protease subunit